MSVLAIIPARSGSKEILQMMGEHIVHCGDIGMCVNVLRVRAIRVIIIYIYIYIYIYHIMHCVCIFM